MTQRFISEFGLNMVANGAVLLQDEHLARLDELLDDDAPEFHIYVIGSRPRIAFDPSTFAFSEDSIRGAFTVQEADQRTSVPFEIPHPPQGRVDALVSQWPHTTFEFQNGGRKVLGGKVALLAGGCPPMRAHLDLEVLYVGQSYGREGEREAPQRLQSHSTLQKILSEASRLQPDREVWLALFHFEELVLASFDGRGADQDPEAIKKDDGRIERMLGTAVSEQQKINFTEAALIRYFEPRYNETFRKTFPSPAHTSYAECYELDLNMVCVELDSEDLYLQLYSAARPRTWHHIAMFPLHDAAERRAMFDLLSP